MNSHRACFLFCLGLGACTVNPEPARAPEASPPPADAAPAPAVPPDTALPAGTSAPAPAPAPPAIEAPSASPEAPRTKPEGRGEWEKLGERWVDSKAANGKGDHDAIRVNSPERFSALQIRDEHSSAEIFDIKVTFGDGSVYSPEVRLKFGAGTTSRNIDFPGERRVIKKVDFRAGNLPGGGRAQIEVWAKK